MSSLWANTLELHQQDFRATNAIDWEECFANKTVETYIFMSLMSYSLNIYLNYIKKTVDDKDLRWMSGWNRNCVIKWKKQCLNMLGQLYGCCSQFAFFSYMAYYSHCYYSHFLKWQSIDSFNRSFFNRNSLINVRDGV